ncbi:MAG: PadR family transcriptional regulator [Coriobacteriia bacterium]
MFGRERNEGERAKFDWGRRDPGGHWCEAFAAHAGLRARRGGIHAAILALLAEQPMHGYQILQELDKRTGGMWTPSPGSIYPSLQALEEQGLVTSEKVGGKRVYTLTEEGQAKAAEQPEEIRPPWHDFAAEGERFSEVREAIKGLMNATRQVLTTGTPDQITRLMNVLVETRKSIYRILAEDE